MGTYGEAREMHMWISGELQRVALNMQLDQPPRTDLELHVRMRMLVFRLACGMDLALDHVVEHTWAMFWKVVVANLRF